MKRMKKQAIADDFTCWCGKAYESLSRLRFHHVCACSVVAQKREEEFRAWKVKEKARRIAQQEADLREWEKEKARGPV